MLIGSSFAKSIIAANMTPASSLEAISTLFYQQGIHIIKQGVDYRFTKEAVIPLSTSPTYDGRKPIYSISTITSFY